MARRDRVRNAFKALVNGLRSRSARVRARLGLWRYRAGVVRRRLGRQVQLLAMPLRHPALIAQRAQRHWRSLALFWRVPAQRNVLYLYGEVIFAGILAAAASFNTAFVLRLGGSSTLVGLLSSLPALLTIFLCLPSARILEQKPNSMPWIVTSLFLSRVSYLLLFAMPFVLSAYLPEASSMVLIAAAVPAVFFSTGWSPLLQDVIPRSSLATVLSWRSILSSGTIALAVWLAGSWLDRGVFPSNYQWMYAVGFLGGAVSVYLVSRIKLPESGLKTAAAPLSRDKVPVREAFRVALRENRSMVGFIASTWLFNLAMWMVSPLYMIYFVRDLRASDGWVGFRTTLAHIGVVLGYWLWRRIIQRTGEQAALRVARPLLATYAILVALVPNITFLLWIGFVINLIGPGVNLSQSVILMDLLPQERRHTWIAIHSMVMNIGAFAAPLLGVVLSDRYGIVPVLLVAGIVRLSVSLVLFAADVLSRRGSSSAPPSSLRRRGFGSGVQ